MDAILARFKSKTYRLQFAVLLLGVLEINFHFLKDYLGDWYGLSFVAISVAGAIVREFTNQSLAAKAEK